MSLFDYFLPVLHFFPECRGEDSVTQPPGDTEYVMDGSMVTLSCTYSGSVYNLQWYRQYPRSEPQFLLSTTVSSKPSINRAKPEDPRLSVKLNEERTRVDLEISSAEVTDSALYYCALRPTLTGNAEP
uniref:Ig-like domain-containing protein n=1 Tax=Esox lucius TaxID=8010 RepID=A0A6Q2YX10_ESOLU